MKRNHSNNDLLEEEPSSKSIFKTQTQAIIPTEANETEEEKKFNESFHDFSLDSLEGQEITFVKKGLTSALYYFNGENMDKWFQVNNFPELNEFAAKSADLYRGGITKCVYHVFITGLVRTGKTTTARFFFPYLHSVHCKRRFNSHKGYEVNYLDIRDFPKLDEKERDFDYASRIIRVFLGEGDVNTCQQGLSKHNHMTDYLKKRRDKMVYFVLDEIQLLSSEALSHLKKAFKSPTLRSVSNFLSIWTGSTQSLLFRNLNDVPANGFSFSDNNLTYEIPRSSATPNLREVAIFHNYRMKRKVVDTNVLKTIRESLEIHHCSYVDKIVSQLDTKSLQEAITNLVQQIFTIYDRDIGEIVKKLTKEVACTIFKIQSIPAYEIERTLTNFGMVSMFFLFNKETQKYELRDSLLSSYISFRLS